MHIDDLEKAQEMKDYVEKLSAKKNGIMTVMEAKKDSYLRLAFANDHIVKSEIVIDGPHLEMYCRMTAAIIENKIKEVEAELKRMGLDLSPRKDVER